MSALRIVAWLGVLLACVGPALAQPDAAALLASAEAAMEDAVRASEAEPALAPELYAEAAARYRRVIAETGIESVELHRAAGNASLLAGDLGRAIASYRRAERLDPTDPRTAESLAYARSRVGTEIGAGLEDRTASVLFWWRGRVPRSVLFAGAVLAFGAAWGIEIAIALGARRVGHLGAVLLWVVSLALFGSVFAEHHLSRGVERAVVVGGATAAHTGPSEVVYPRSFDQQLVPGVELVVLAHQDGWVHVRLADGREAWVPERAIERV